MSSDHDFQPEFTLESWEKKSGVKAMDRYQEDHGKYAAATKKIAANEAQMCPPKPASLKDYSGPCRELAKTTLQVKIRELEDRLVGLKHLLRIAESLEDGSPAENVLHRLLYGERL